MIFKQFIFKLFVKSFIKHCDPDWVVVGRKLNPILGEYLDHDSLVHLSKFVSSLVYEDVDPSVLPWELSPLLFVDSSYEKEEEVLLSASNSKG